MARIVIFMIMVAGFASSCIASDRLPNIGTSRQEIEAALGAPFEPAGKMIFTGDPSTSELMYPEANPPRIYTMREGFCIGICYSGPKNLGLSKEEALALLKVHAEGNEFVADGENRWKCEPIRWFATHEAKNSRLSVGRWRYPR